MQKQTFKFTVEIDGTFNKKFFLPEHYGSMEEQLQAEEIFAAVYEDFKNQIMHDIIEVEAGELTSNIDNGLVFTTETIKINKV